MKKHVIWSSIVDLEEWQEFFTDFEKYNDITLSENDKWQFASECNDGFLECEKENLDIELPGKIIEIGYIQTWRGKRYGYKECNTQNIADCLHSNSRGFSENEWYTDQYNMHHMETHHDGTNKTFYRMLRPELSDLQVENFLNMLYNGKASARAIRRYTKSIAPYVRAAYGY